MIQMIYKCQNQAASDSFLLLPTQAQSGERRPTMTTEGAESITLFCSKEHINALNRILPAGWQTGAFVPVGR